MKDSWIKKKTGTKIRFSEKRLLKGGGERTGKSAFAQGVLEKRHASPCVIELDKGKKVDPTRKGENRKSSLLEKMECSRQGGVERTSVLSNRVPF